MAGGADATKANNVLAAITGEASFTAIPGTHCRLMAANGSDTSAGTELSSSGYTAGGAAVTWASPSAESIASNSILSWTNTSGSSWSLTGVEIWSTDGTPVRIAWGPLATNPTTVPAGATFQIASGSLTLALV